MSKSKMESPQKPLAWLIARQISLPFTSHDKYSDSYTLHYFDESEANAESQLIQRFLAVFFEQEHSPLSIDCSMVTLSKTSYQALTAMKAKNVLVKSLRWDEHCFIDSFILGITPTKITNHRPPLRRGPHKAFTVFATGVYEYHNRPSPYLSDGLDEKKKERSKHQSTSLISPYAEPPVFGHSKVRVDKLVGVMLDADDALINRYFLYDIGTVNRPYEANTRQKAENYHRQKTAEASPVLFANPNDFTNELAKHIHNNKHNEVLARIRWNPVSSSIGVFSDTFEARCVASYYAERLLIRLKQQYIELNKAWDDSYQVPIVFYLPGHDKNWTHYTFEQRLIDKNKAEMIYNHPVRCQNAIRNNQAEFLLILDNPEEVWQNLNTIYPFLSFVDNNQTFLIEALHHRRQTAQTFSDALQDYTIRLRDKPGIIEQLLTTDKNGDTIFHRTIKKGLIDWLSFLLELNPNHTGLLDSANKEGQTPLSMAIARGYSPIVSILLNRNLDINQIRLPRSTLLMIASANGRLDIVTMLLDYGADINQVDDHGSTALLTAIVNEKIDTVKLLVGKGANIFQANHNKLTPLLAALKVNSQEIIHLLTPHINLYEANENSKGQLICIAVKKENLTFINQLLNNGVNPNTTTYAEKPLLTRQQEHQPLLHLATEQGNLMIIELLLEHNAQINQTDERGETALHIAVHKGNIAIISALIDKGADVNINNYRQETPLRKAISKSAKQYQEIVNLLLKSGADLQKADVNPQEPLLCIAAYHGHLEVVIALLNAGADINKKGGIYNTPFLSAIRLNHLNIVKTLLQHGLNTDKIQGPYDRNPLHDAAESGNAELVAILLDIGFNIEQPDTWGDTPICFAANRGHLNVVTLLLDRGANPCPSNKIYQSPLCAAAFNGYEPIVMALLNANVDVNKPNTNGDTPLSNAIHLKHLGCVKLLLNKNAKVNTINTNGNSPLQLAIINGCLDIIQLLLEKNAELAIDQKHIDKAITKGHHPIVLYVQQLQKNRELFHHPCQLIHQALIDYAHSFNEPAFFSQQTTQDKKLLRLLKVPQFINQTFDEALLTGFLQQLKINYYQPKNILTHILTLCRLLTGIDCYHLPEMQALAIADNPSLAK